MKVLWSNTIRNVTVSILEAPNSFGGKRLVVQVVHETYRTTHVDYPIQYDNGSIAYDFPERVPQYAIPTIVKAFKAKNALVL